MQPIVNNKFSSADLQNRLNSKIDKSGDCWLWTGSVNSRGYGGIIIDGKYFRAHRIMYEMFKGKIPKGLEVDHLCEVRTCVNPEHLEAVTHSENMKRSSLISKPRRRRRWGKIGPCDMCGIEAPAGRSFCSNKCRRKSHDERHRNRTLNKKGEE